jgi:hypothetical protein
LSHGLDVPRSNARPRSSVRRLESALIISVHPTEISFLGDILSDEP